MIMPRTAGLLAACFCIAACSEAPPTTWARKMTREQAQHWGESCGPESTAPPKFSTAETMSRGWYTDRADGVTIGCRIDWDEAQNRVKLLKLSANGPEGYTPALADLVPYLHLLEDELPPSLRPELRRLAVPAMGHVRKGKLVIDNYFVPRAGRGPDWFITVTEPRP